MPEVAIAELAIYWEEAEEAAFRNEVATARSGTHIPVLVSKQFAEVRAARFMKAHDFHHNFSCEVCRKKRSFLQTMMGDDGLDLLFSDAKYLANGVGGGGGRPRRRD